MREFLSIIINPIPVICFLVLFGLILFKRNKKRTGKALLIIAGFWFLLVSTPPLPELMAGELERKFPQLSDSYIKNVEAPCNIIVLGGGHSDDAGLSPNNKLSLIALSRLVEGIRIHRMIPDSKLILSGFDKRSEQSEALVYFQTAISLGVDSTSMIFQASPSNTQQEAEDYVKNFGTDGKLILVTSAIHMPRSVMHFKNYGISPMPAPTDFILKNESRKHLLRWIPSANNIDIMESAIHEYAGIIWANIFG